jgi:hypothetical protein
MLPSHVKELLQDVYGTRWGEAYLEWGLFDATGFHRKGFDRALTASPPDDMAVFWSAGLLKPGTGRADANVEHLKVFVMDDVGKVPGKSRIDPDELELMMPQPTSRPESSPGNAQWQWGLTDGMDEGTVTALRASLPWQSHATAMSNLIRVPMGVSGKPGIVHTVTDLERGPVYTAAEFIQKCGGLRVPVRPVVRAAGNLMAPTEAAVVDILKTLPNDGTSPYCDSYQAWINFGLALYGATGGTGIDLWLQWCGRQPQVADPEDKWQSFQPTSSGWATLVMYSDKWGSDRRALAGALFNDGVDLPVDSSGDKIIDLTPPPKVKRPPRPWLYGRRLIRGYLSSTVAAGGVGKSSLTMVEAVAMASGRDLLGVGADHMPREPLRVLIWNGEDPRAELELRLEAIQLHHGVSEAEIGGRLFMLSGREVALNIPKMTGSLKKTLRHHRIDVMLVDPFVSSHQANENDNMAIDGVAKAWSAIAEDCHCAIDLVHHIRKPSASNGTMDLTVDDARGASALINASRNARVLSPMGTKVAAQFGIVNPRAYFANQKDATKANMVPGMVGTDWFHFASVDMGNGDMFPVDGLGPIPADNVGVVEKWIPSTPLAAQPANIVAAQAEIAKGSFRMSSQAKGWVGAPIAGVLGLDAKADRRVLETVVRDWVREGWLVVVEKLDSHREMKEFIEVGNAPEVPEF